MMINFNIEQSTAIITLNRPEKRNALHPDLVSRLKESLNHAEQEESVKAVIITGEGKSFCAGADLEYLDQLRNFSAIENEKDSENLAELFIQIYKFPKPTIAAVNGAAIAGGCGLASVCDFIVANPDVKFGYSEVKIGFIPAIVSIFLMKRIGEGPAKNLLLTGELIDGKRGYEIGFVNYLSDSPIDKAMELADTLAANSSLSLGMTKAMINSISNMNVEDAVNYCINLNAVSRSSEDFKQGINNFLNKR